MIRAHHLSFLFCLALQGCANDEPVPSRSLPAAAQDDLQQTIERVVESGAAPGVSIAVQRPGYKPWSGAAGVADTESAAPMTRASRFRAGSVLKVAVATAVLQLIEAGELSLDAPLSDLLPSDLAERIPDGRAITLRMLLNHTSGIPEFSDDELDAVVLRDPERVWPLDELLSRALARPPRFEPGAEFAYSNTNYSLLGLVLEQATAQPWRTVLRERVFARAQLRSSTLPEEGDSRCSGCARGYHPFEDTLIDITEGDPSMAGAAGGEALLTTPGDMAQLLRALAHGELFDDPKTLDLMLTFADAPIPEELQTGYGLGIARYRQGDVEIFGHLGGTAGYQGFVLYWPATDTVASGYLNAYGGLGDLIVPVLGAVERLR